MNHTDEQQEDTTSGLKIRRRFTSAGQHPFKSITFVSKPSNVVAADGTLLSAAPIIEVPDSWDQVAVDILASKYLRKTGVPQNDEEGEPLLDEDGNRVLGPERSAREAVLRLANAWRIWGEREGYFATSEDAEAFRDEIAYMIITQMASPNSPQWFNTGLFEAYDIVENPDGNWYFVPDKGHSVESAHKYERSSANACFILNVEDRLVGPVSIMRHIEDSARLFKAGSGVGANYSKIREQGASLTGGGSSSGVMSFLRVHDRAAGAIKSGGRTRRAAKMVILNVDHPDIEEFVESKVLEERKVSALAAAGYSVDFNGEAYDTVAFQNANHSVRITPGFMKAVREDAIWDLTSRRDGAPVKSIRARELWDEIAEAAWSCADPGLQFDDLTNDWNTVLDIERINASNPCSEFLFLDNTACNLASLNVVKFWDNERDEFDIPAYLHAIRLWTIVLEITVAMSHYPTAASAERSYMYRPLGLGYANIGALLMRSGLAYDSDQARTVIGALTALLTFHAYETSAEMAAEFGPFEMYDRTRQSLQKVIANHRRAAYGSEASAHGISDYQQLTVAPYEINHRLLKTTPFGSLSDVVVYSADRMQEATSLHGVRNSQVTVLAPAGTIGLLMGCDTTGIEPDFALVKLKKLVGGHYLHIVNQSVRPALQRLGYNREEIERLLKYLIGTREFGEGGPLGRQALRTAGFEETEIDVAEKAIATAPEVTWAFASGIIGEDAFSRLSVDPLAGGAALLAAAGFPQSDLDDANDRICGHGTLDGSADLNPDHLDVFDTSVASGPGTRSIHWTGHVKAVAAASPFLSGGVSKTVNMPHDATVTDVRALYEMAYALGVKSVAMYRDGSKQSQPLQAASQAHTSLTEDDQIEQILRFAQVPEGMSPLEFYGEHNPPRFRLPSIRAGVTWRFEIAGEEVYLRSGEYPDGSLGEVFVDWGKPGSTLRGMTSALSIALSQGLQHGVPLERFVRALRDHNFEPHGVVIGHPNLKMARSLIDAIVRILGHHYLHDESLVQVEGMPPFRVELVAPDKDPDISQFARPNQVSETAPTVLEPASPQAPAEAVGRRLYGERCPTCGSENLLKTGTCSVCGDCGATTGCS